MAWILSRWVVANFRLSDTRFDRQNGGLNNSSGDGNYLLISFLDGDSRQILVFK